MARSLSLFVLLTACSSSVPPFASDDVAIIDASVQDATLSDSSSDAKADTQKFGGGGPFSCGGCVCDGTLAYCKIDIGPANMPIDDAGDSGFGDASACDLDAAAEFCTRIPIACLPNPSCDCVKTYNLALCSCDIDPTGNGIVVNCFHP